MRVAKTSTTSPLRIDAVQVNESGGLVGMTLCPGKKDKGILSGPWDRDLDMDLEAIRQVKKARVGAIQTSSQEDYVWRMGNRQSR